MKTLKIIIFAAFLVGLNFWVWSDWKKNDIESVNSNIPPARLSVDNEATNEEKNNTDDGAQEEDLFSDWEMGDVENIDFYQLKKEYVFSGDISSSWEVEYIKDADAINIFNPQAEQEKNIDKSLIFVRSFVADDFSDPDHFDILNKEEKNLSNHKSILYEVEKKDDVDDFKNQPQWKNDKHKILLVRFWKKEPSIFFEISYSSELSDESFDSFVNSLIFYNDKISFSPPILSIDISKKPFGILVSPENSPVSPEKFSGYHTGTDFEIASEDLEKEFSVFAVCFGEVESVKKIDGYGGVMVQKCILEDEEIRVLYGHINIDKISVKEGEYLPSGKEFVILADNASELSGGERKHLHLGIFRGSKIDVRGYVQDESELSKWIDFGSIVNLNNIE
jgi:hypothetical protein